jgi:hypothetical protein
MAACEVPGDGAYTAMNEWFDDVRLNTLVERGAS